MLRQFSGHVTDQVFDASAVIGEDVEDAVLVVVRVYSKPRRRVRLLQHQRSRVAQELFDLLLVAFLRFESQDQSFRVRFREWSFGKLVCQYVEFLYLRWL